ncbi:MAG: SIR2 family protein [Nitrosomonas ureae]
MNSDLHAAITNGELVLFLGAGASKGCTSKNGKAILDGAALAEHLASVANYEYDGEALDEVYAAVRSKLQSRLDEILENLFRDIRPSAEFLKLTSFAWRRIYTLNIDDALESAIRRNNVQALHVHLAKHPISDRDVFFKRLDLIKLNGSIDQLGQGVIFSASEYAKSTARSLPWYEQCASDFIRSPTLFIGTKINEPLLKFHIERYKSVTNKAPGQSYVITPSATPLQKQALADYNIQHIAATLGDFVEWLTSSFPRALKPLDLAVASMPQLSELLTSSTPWNYASLFDHVIPIKKSTIAGRKKASANAAILDFYKGFRPSWDDIAEEVPARLDVLLVAKEFLSSNFSTNRIFPLVGPAGSGKTTLLMQLCFDISNESGFDVYFIEQPISRLAETLEAIERTSKAPRIVVGIDNVDFASDQLKEAFSSKRLQRTMLLGAERENIWKRKSRTRLGAFSFQPLMVDEFTNADAERILEKLESYGSWTRLGQMSPKQRISELVVRAQKQLLIALLEATFGLGYGEIIARDFSTLETDEEKLCFLVVGLITDRKHDAPVALVDRALSSIGILNQSTMVSNHLAGIVMNRSGKLSVRHPVYVRYILDHLVDPSLTVRALAALLAAFSQYESPVIKHVEKLEATIYKGLINHAFLRDVLKGRREFVLSLYKSLEKKFELDGLFWLQYGLSLRDFGEHQESLEKLRTAYEAYQMEHTQHALGQQLLIVAERSSDKQTALTYANEAIEILEVLDRVIQSDDTFPVVTLAEGYTKVMRRHGEEDAARRKAIDFAARLKARSDAAPDDDRLRKAYENMFRYAATGTWVDTEED